MEVDFLPSLAAEVCVWPFFQALSFWKIPVKHQLLAVNMFAVFDAAFLSWARNSDDWYNNLFHDSSRK